MKTVTSALSILVAGIAVAVTLLGETGSVVFLNWWLTVFPNAGGAPFAIQLSSSVIYFLVFLLTVLFGFLPLFGFTTIKVIVRAKGWKGLHLSVWMGFTDLLSNIIAVYAATHVPEILQAFLQTTVPPWALLLQYFFVKNQRALGYNDKLLIGSLILAATGIIGSSIPAHPTIRHEYTDDLGSFIAWVLLFASTAAIYAGWCIIQRNYCDHVPVKQLLAAVRLEYHQHLSRPQDSNGGGIFSCLGTGPLLLRRVLRRRIPQSTTTARDEDSSNAREGVDADDSQKESTHLVNDHHHHDDHDDEGFSSGIASTNEDEEAELLIGALEKTLMLLGDTFFQVLWIFVLLPIDALPWFGTSPNLTATWSNLVQALHCVTSCPGNFVWCALYSLSYFVSYIGDAYLNRVSPTLCCILIQLSAPVTAILLLVFPVWNVSDGGSAGVLWWQQSLACLIMIGSAVLYYLWERKQEESAWGPEGGSPPAETEPYFSGGETRIRLPLPNPLLEY